MKPLPVREGLIVDMVPVRDGKSGDFSLQKSADSLHLRILHSADEVLMELSVRFSKIYLEAWPQASEIWNTFSLFEQQEACCDTQLLVQEMLQHQEEGIWYAVFMESKAMELLLNFRKCSVQMPMRCDSCKFLSREAEKDKIVQAREILLRNIQQPPTIASLARQIGINQCYLKKGFRELYGYTMYEFVTEQRMLRAKTLLRNPEQRIADVAEQIGFSSQSSFTTAFKKFTGMVPSEFVQN